MNLRSLLTIVALGLLAAGCNSTNPVAPDAPTPPAGGAGTFSIGLSATPPDLEVGSPTPSVVAVSVSPAPADGTKVTLSTNLGTFGEDGTGKPITTKLLELHAGQAQANLFAGDATGTAHLLAQVETATKSLDVAVHAVVIKPFYLISVEPGFGSASGGTPVVIHGAGFAAPVRVTFGGVTAAVGTVTETTIQAVAPRTATPVPSDETAVVDVTVENDLGKVPASDKLAGAFTYTNGTSIDQPVILSVVPASGPNAGSTEVTLTGSGFESNVQVFFGLRGAAGFDGVQATVLLATPTTVRVLSPAAASPGVSLLNKQVDVLLRNVGSGFQTTAAAAFKYVGQQLLVSTVDPRQGPYTGGTQVTIGGQGFVPPVEVQFGGVSQQVQSVSPDGKTIIAQSVGVTVRDCKPPSGPLTVKNLGTGEMATTGFLFEYTANPPVIQSLVPASGRQAGGETVEIRGTGFESGSKVEFNGVPSVSPTITATSIRATTPAFTGAFENLPCDDNGDGQMGMRSQTKAVDVKVTSLATGCASLFPMGFTYRPTDTTCRGDLKGPPVAGFDFTVDNLRVLFTDRSGGGSPASWLWRFGDTGTSTEPNPVHTYAAPGNYAVQLTVTNVAGSSSVTKTVAVVAPAPIASFTAIAQPTPAHTVQFTDTSSGPPTSWLWTFGDAMTSTLQHPLHTYAAAGTYNVTLVVTNSSGSNGRTQAVVVP